MAVNARGLAVYRSGWSGGVTLASTTDTTEITAPEHASPLDFAQQIQTAGILAIGSDFTFSVTAAGKIAFGCTTGFSMTFTETAGTRIGYASDSTYSTSHTAGTVARGSIYPYETDGMLYTLDVPVAMRPGYSLQGTAIMRRIPGLDWISPDAQIQATRKIALETIEAFEFMDTPAKLDVLIDPNTVVTLHVGKVRMKTDDELSGWAAIELEVAK